MNRRPSSRPARPRRGPGRTPVWTPPWRAGIPIPPKEDPAAEGAGVPKPIGDVLEGLLGSDRRLRTGLATGDLGRRWSDVVGAPLAAETAPGGIDEAGVLTVRVSSAAWATQIRFLAAAVVANANEVLGGEIVTGVKVVVGPPASAV